MSMKMKTVTTVLSMLLGVCLYSQHVPTDSSTVTTTKTAEQKLNFFAPNAFTPDGDSFNETWRVYIEGIDIFDFHLTVFNSSGQIVWESFNASGEWDGSFGGIPVQGGIYPWILQTKSNINDEKFQFTGFITLLR